MAAPRGVRALLAAQEAADAARAAAEDEAAFLASIKGDKGEPGDKGDTGDRGPAGEQGPRGETGPQGERGDVGPQGDPGSVGPPGPAGQDGAEGDPGAVGPRGLEGPKGLDGHPGRDGSDGAAAPALVNAEMRYDSGGRIAAATAFYSNGEARTIDIVRNAQGRPIAAIPRGH